MNSGGYPDMGMPQLGMQMGQPPMGMSQGLIGQQQLGQPHMNPQTIQKMGQATGQPQMANPMNQRNQSHTNPQISQQHQILSYLRLQIPPPGWQQTCRIEIRLSIILQIITQLSLLGNENPSPSPLSIAIEFERDSFQKSVDQIAYEQTCREKLQQLADARQSKQRGQQNSLSNMNHQNMSMFAPQPQIQQPQGFTHVQQPTPTSKIALQQQQQQQVQQQAQMQMRSGITGQTPFANGQQGNHFQFTSQDQLQITEIANNMFHNLTQQGKRHVEQAVMSLQPQLRQTLLEKGVDLVQYVIKQKATQAFLQQRNRMNAAGGTPGNFVQPATPVQVQQTPQLEQLGSMDQIRRAQRDALHHQQEGKVVVPANSQQRPGNAQRAPSRLQKTPQPAHQFAGSRPMQTPNQTPQQSQSSWNKPTPSAQNPPQSQAFAQSHQTSGLLLNPSMNATSKSQNLPSPKPMQQMPTAQRPLQNPQQSSLPSSQLHTIPNMPPRGAIPPYMQQHLDSLKTDEEKQRFLLMMRQKQMLQRQQAEKSQLNTQQGQAVSQRQTTAQASDLPQVPFRPGLTEIQEKQMDVHPYPENILNSNSVLAQVPGHVKSWAQLKAWVAANAHRLPHDSLQKLRQLQAKHYNLKMSDMNEERAGRGQLSNMSTQPANHGPASNAPMFQDGQPVLQQYQPTPQEIQRFRASLPQANVMSDEQIRLTIMARKNKEAAKPRPNPQSHAVQNQQILQQRYSDLMKQAEQSNQNEGSQRQLQQGTSQPQQTQHPQLGIPNVKKQTEQWGQTQIPRQGLKRGNEQDMVEAQDPTTHTSSAVQPQMMSIHAQRQLASLNRLTPAQLAGMTPAYRAAIENQRKTLIAQTTQHGVGIQEQPHQAYANSRPIPKKDDYPKTTRVRQLREEVTRSLTPRQAVGTSPTERAAMVQKLRDSRNLFPRITQSLPVFLQATNNEARVKDIIRAQTLLSAQVRDNEHNPVDNFTITFEEFTKAFSNLQRYSVDMSSLVQQMHKAQQKQSQQNGADGQVTPQTQQLSIANLQRQQATLTKARAAAVQKPSNDNQPPTAPTTRQVPFPFGSQSPQGVPQIYVAKKNELTQEKLQLPIPKKQKKNQTTNAALTQSRTTMSPLKVDSPEADRIRCPEPDCKHSIFASKALFDKHIKESHEVKDEQIKDPLDYVLGGLRMALSLDEQGRSKPQPKGGSRDWKSSIKVEATRATSKPLMGQNLSQPKISTSISRDEKVDTWSNANIPQHWFSEVFRDVADINHAITSDFLTTWLGIHPAPELSFADDDSPQSVDKVSSHKSDIGEPDIIDLAIIGEEGYLTENWFETTHDTTVLDNVGSKDTIDWDATWEAGLVGNMDTKAEGDTSNEWLRVYAPEKYSERLKSVKAVVR